MAQRRFPPPWTIEELNDACFVVSDKCQDCLGGASEIWRGVAAVADPAAVVMFVCSV